MVRIRPVGRGALRALVAAALFALAGYAAATFFAAPGSAAGPVLTATVGPGFTITLTQNGTPVTTLAPGEYTVNVTDNSSIHNFHLSGPGVDQATAVGTTGTSTWDVTFSAGTYNYVCDAHSYDMNGSFTVASTSTTTSSTTATTANTTTAPPSTSITTTTTTSGSSTSTTTSTATGTTATTTASTTSPAGAVVAAAVVQSVRVSASGKGPSRIVAVRVDLSKAATVRARLVRRGRMVASLRRAVGTKPTVLRLLVPAAVPGGRYKLELVITANRISQRMARTVQLRP